MLSERIEIQVNGEARAARRDVTVAELLQELDIRGDRVAVELNLEILDRQEFTERRLQPGDRVEIISFIGGGWLRGLCLLPQRLTEREHDA